MNTALFHPSEEICKIMFSCLTWASALIVKGEHSTICSYEITQFSSSISSSMSSTSSFHVQRILFFQMRSFIHKNLSGEQKPSWKSFAYWCRKYRRFHLELDKTFCKRNRNGFFFVQFIMHIVAIHPICERIRSDSIECVWEIAIKAYSARCATIKKWKC